MPITRTKSSSSKKLSDQGLVALLIVALKSGPDRDADVVEVQSAFSKFQSELQQLAQKIGEIESEAEEYECVCNVK